MSQAEIQNQSTVFGHPSGLYTLFFAEMWERFSYYGMRALLIFYMLKGFLGYGDAQAYTVYGAYTALVYMTPFLGGLLADKYLGKRLAVVLGGLLMAAGHLLMTWEAEWPFFFALAFLIAGNGFFKPNISTTVGSLYEAGNSKRDDGFNIFYTGINLGAAISPLLCGYVGETFGWHYGFGLATIGMLVGLAVFVMPNVISQRRSAKYHLPCPHSSTCLQGTSDIRWTHLAIHPRRIFEVLVRVCKPCFIPGKSTASYKRALGSSRTGSINIA